MPCQGRSGGISASLNHVDKKGRTCRPDIIRRPLSSTGCGRGRLERGPCGRGHLAPVAGPGRGYFFHAAEAFRGVFWVPTLYVCLCMCVCVRMRYCRAIVLHMYGVLYYITYPREISRDTRRLTKRGAKRETCSKKGALLPRVSTACGGAAFSTTTPSRGMSFLDGRATGQGF
jgi:hypothetical protein